MLPCDILFPKSRGNVDIILNSVRRSYLKPGRQQENMEDLSSHAIRTENEEEAEKNPYELNQPSVSKRPLLRQWGEQANLDRNR